MSAFEAVPAGNPLLGKAGRFAGFHNPFYLLSAFTMLLGCLLLSHALQPAPGQAGKLLLLLGVLNVYEGLVISLALLLIVRHRNVRDGGTLLWLTALFLADATFLGSELHASDLGTGAMVAGSLLVLALVKLGVIARVLRVPLGPPAWFALVPVALLLAVPGVFAALAQSHLLNLPFVYLFWWVLAALMVGQTLVERGWAGAKAASPAGEGAAALRTALGVLPLASLGLHLLGAGFAQGVRFNTVFLGPPLLALGFLTLLREVPGRPTPGLILWPSIALMASLSPPSSLVAHGPWDVTLTPLRLAFLVAGLTYVLAARVHRLRWLGVGGGLCLLSALAGHSVYTIFSNLHTVLRTVLSWPVKLVPRTVGQWGVLSVALSFLLLALGAGRSLRRPQSDGRPTREGR